MYDYVYQLSFDLVTKTNNSRAPTGLSAVHSSFFLQISTHVSVKVTFISVLSSLIISRSCHPTYPLGARAELKGDAVVGLREICIALARFV